MFKVAGIQYCAGDNHAQNLKHIKPMIKKAAETALFVALPEAATYIAADPDQLMSSAEWDDDSPSQRELSELARSLNIWLLIGSLILRKKNKNQLVNRSLLVKPNGDLACIYDKIHMFDADIGDGQTYRESNKFTSGSSPILAKVGTVNVGLSICYDVRFPHLYRKLAQDGAKILLVPSAFTEKTGRAHWHVLLRARAIENGCFVIAPAQSGTHADGRKTFGHSLIVDPWGTIIADAGIGDAVITAELDLNAVEQARKSVPSLYSNPIIEETKKYR